MAVTLSHDIRNLRTVAECEAWRARQGDMDSMTTMAFLMRIAALRNFEAGLRQTHTAGEPPQT